MWCWNCEQGYWVWWLEEIISLCLLRGDAYHPSIACDITTWSALPHGYRMSHLPLTQLRFSYSSERNCNLSSLIKLIELTSFYYLLAHLNSWVWQTLSVHAPNIGNESGPVAAFPRPFCEPRAKNLATPFRQHGKYEQIHPLNIPPNVCHFRGFGPVALTILNCFTTWNTWFHQTTAPVPQRLGRRSAEGTCWREPTAGRLRWLHASWAKLWSAEPAGPPKPYGKDGPGWPLKEKNLAKEQYTQPQWFTTNS